MKNKHYHILAGLHGYLPNINEVYKIKQDARMGLKELIEWDRETGAKYSGNLREGYFECLNFSDCHTNEYYEITECNIKECLEDIIE